MSCMDTRVFVFSSELDKPLLALLRERGYAARDCEEVLTHLRLNHLSRWGRHYRRGITSAMLSADVVVYTDVTPANKVERLLRNAAEIGVIAFSVDRLPLFCPADFEQLIELNEATLDSDSEQVTA